MDTVLSAFSLPKNLRQLFVRPHGNYAALDGLRAISVLSVLIYHCFMASDFIGGLSLFQRLHEAIPGWMKWVWQGPLGVDTFFVISGFLIGTMLMKELNKTHKVNFQTFYVRRFLRLAPVYYLSLLLIDLGVTHGTPPEHASFFDYIKFALSDDAPPHMWRNYLYITNFFPMKENDLTYTWSLAVEEQFYLIFPLFLVLFYKKTAKPLLLLVGAYLISFLIRWGILVDEGYYSALKETGTQLTDQAREWNGRYFETLYDNLYSHYGSILCGVIAAHLNLHHKNKLTNFFTGQILLATGLLALSLLLIGLIYMTTIPSPFIDYSEPFNTLVLVSFQNIFCAGVTYLMLACFYGKDWISKSFNWFFSLKLWYPLAQLSYSIYLFHFILVGLLVSINRKYYDRLIATVGVNEWDIWKLVLVATVVSFIIATIMYLILERPIMNLRQAAPAEPNKD